MNICLRPKKNNYEYEIKNNWINEEPKKNKEMSKDLIQRLYYKYHFKKLGFNEVVRTKKLTEFITLNLAKNKTRMRKLEEMLNLPKRSYSFI